MGIFADKLRVLEGENVLIVGQLRHHDQRLLLLDDVTTWGINVTRVGADALSVYSLLLQSPTISMFENSLAVASSIDADATGTGVATFTRASGSWVDDRYFVGASVEATLFPSSPTNATWVVSAVTDTDLTVIDPNDDIVTDATSVGSVALSDASARDATRLINDALWTKGGEEPGHNLQYVLDRSVLTPNEPKGLNLYELTLILDCSNVSGQSYGVEYHRVQIEVESNQAI